MKCKLNFILLALLLTISSSILASPLATFNYKVFYVPEKGRVIETYFDISGKSVVLTEDQDGNLTAEVELTLIFKQGEDIVTYDKKSISSPPMNPDNIIDFLDIQRFAIPSGVYDLEIQIRDLNDPVDKGKTNILEIDIPTVPEGAFVSDIELISAFKKTSEPGLFSKSGYDILPMVNDDHLHTSMKEVIYYAEIYKADEALSDGDMFLAKTYFEGEDGNELASTVQYMRKKTSPVVPIIARFNLEEVPTNTYKIVLEARDRENNLLARNGLDIYRTHPGKEINLEEQSEDLIAGTWVEVYDQKTVLWEHVKSLRPKADNKEKTYIDEVFENAEESDMDYLKIFFYNFWDKRNPEDSKGEWIKYKEQVRIADEKFGTPNKKGYETDRGRVFLQYGPPDEIADRANEPSSYPYQIWHYYKASNFNNVRFVFYDPMLMAIDYELLHCEYIPGERMQRNWRLLLEQRNTPMNNVDRNSGTQHYGGRVDEFYRLPSGAPR